MFPTRKRIVLLHLSGKLIRTTADHPFFVQSKSWTDAADFQHGDKLRTHDGQDVSIDAITDTSWTRPRLTPTPAG